MSSDDRMPQNGKPDGAGMTGVALIAGLLALIVSAGCGGGSAGTRQLQISVSLSETAFTVPPQATTQFTAIVTNDPSGKGVTWSMTCNGATCGSVSPAATASGAPTTYTAPGPPGVTLMVKLTATSVADTTKSATVAITVPTSLVPISVSVSPQAASVPSGGVQEFTATVTNDPNNAGVTWQVLAELLCNGISSGKGCQKPGETPVIYLGCATCGTVSAATTASGAPTTYNAPAHLTPPSQAGYFFSGALAIVATSVTNTSASAGAYPVVVLYISVSVPPVSASVALNGAQQFTASVSNDGTNKGVTWTLAQNGVACAPGCGTISPATTASGVAATYTAPVNAPVTPLVRVIATSIEDSSILAGASVTLTTPSGAAACSAGSGSESLLNGQYAFLLQGDVAGSLTASGTGKITGGEEDLLGAGGSGNIDAATSSYAVGPDRRGCLVLNLLANTNHTVLSTAVSFSFSLGSSNSSSIAAMGHIIELERLLSGGGIEGLDFTEGGAGTLRLQDASSFSANQFNGNYVLGFVGDDLQMNGRRVAIAGTLAVDGVSAISSATFDINDVGTVISNFSSAPEGTFTCCDASGRGTLAFGNLRAPSMGFYMINSGDVFLVAQNNDIDAIQGVGEAIAIPAGTIFSQTSLSGTSVLRATAQSTSSAVVDLATINADGKSAMTENDNVNNAGTFNSSSTALNYTVGANGRVTLTGGNTPPVLYLYGPNQGFVVGTDPDVTFGILEPQAAGPFSNSSFSGDYVFGTEYPSVNSVTMESGVLTADGKGNAAGTVDQSNPTGVTLNQSLNLTYSFPGNGVGNMGNNTTAILISGNKLVFINNADPNPTIKVVEK